MFLDECVWRGGGGGEGCSFNFNFFVKRSVYFYCVEFLKNFIFI